MRIATVLIFSCLTALGFTFDLLADEEKLEPLPTFIFVGQSNMVGKRCRAEELPAQLQQVNSYALFFQAKTKSWVAIAPGRTEPSGFGPEIAFASVMAEQLGHSIGIIKHSRGGTNLHRQWNPADEKSLFGELTKKVKAARAARPIEVVGMLWVQGGADSKTKLMANAYSANLKQLVTRSRVEFGTPEMAFLSGRIPAKSDKVKPFWKAVRQAQQDLKMDNYAWVNCDDITTGSDGIHYDAKGMVTLGQRQAKMMENLLRGEDEQPQASDE
jgi:hypothetical protein